MADAIRLINTADEAGLKFRVAYYLVKKSAAVLAEVTPDPIELTLAKQVALDGGESHKQEVSRTLVTITSVADALAAADYDHKAFGDTQLETQVNAIWPTYAKSLAA